MAMIGRILVPTDGSERAEKGARYAIDLAGETGASLVFLSVVDDISPAYGYETESISPTIPEIQADLERISHTYVDRLLKAAEEAGVGATSKVVLGSPAEEIVRAAEDVNADLIVISSHGRRALAAAVTGSVTINVIHGSKIPVTVVPARKEE